jgi:hypothetical protein
MKDDKHHPQSKDAPATTAAEGGSTNWSSFFLHHPIKTLTVFFWAWKVILFLVIVNSPGPGYDTSTTLLSDVPLSNGAALGVSGSPFAAAVLKFVRWDSIYFVRIAERGYLFEQEWAFGYGYTRLLGHLMAGAELS